MSYSNGHFAVGRKMMAVAQSGSRADPLTMMQMTRKRESHQEFTNNSEPDSLLRRPPSSSSQEVMMIVPSSKTRTIFDNSTQHCDDDDDDDYDDDGKKKKKKTKEEEVPWWKKVLDPKRKSVQHWNKLFVLSCFFALFVDPLFFFTIGINPEYKCVVFNYPWAIVFTVLRSVTDFILLLHMLLQFRLAYESNNGKLVFNRRAIADRYVYSHAFVLDVITVLPLPQIVIMVFVRNYTTRDNADFLKNVLRVIVLLQDIPRCIRFFPILIGQSPSGFVFETAWANFIINIFMYLLASHVVGCCWYLFGLQRVNSCLQNACTADNASSILCFSSYLDCGLGDPYNRTPADINWTSQTSATSSCLLPNATFQYGIYGPMGFQVAQESSVVKKYIYSVFWGFLQLSTLAGNQIPSLFVWEVLFTMGISGLGLFLFALLIGNIQNFLQSLVRRGQEMQMRRYDVEKWMRRRNLPLEMRKSVRATERLKWGATRGVEENELLSGLQEDLRSKIKQFISLELVRKVPLFKVMDAVVLDAICARLQEQLYIKNSKIMTKDSPIKRMHFIVRGRMRSEGEDGMRQELSDGDYCGEELLFWYLEKMALKPRGTWKKRIKWQFPVSFRTVTCLDNVEAFALEASDLEDISTNYYRHMSTVRVQGALRNGSACFKTWAATRIQVAWRYYLKRRARSGIIVQDNARRSGARIS
ncbi:unnamed protein product [Sphagnum jensenii]|uniref:Cyclic nucleotide-binding domain-containing protein n=2 Tax=Sphagnum jensenii TaxID=128206 RepID=A0ABP1BI23_9BRYO